MVLEQLLCSPIECIAKTVLTGHTANFSCLVHAMTHTSYFGMNSVLLSGLQIRECTRKLFSYFSTKIYVVGTQKKRLNETVLLSTQNMMRKKIITILR